ncbi:M64 family metallopeptidase [Massilia sp. DJPM01]|uniref:M64 family metallopeptidase n=1 Tax=Massilia sp. DJPM01 TaxID=3024404 RepID=UPI00259E282A|nr:M64 family metallopeptidase [Massilia sp. DJPM01]MDM5181696.1 M64 family metallopeptidase [Massilia sp. DJPM01]
MKLLTSLSLTLVAMASLTVAAQAQNISLRVSVSEGRSGVNFAPIHAEVGDFALTPSLPGHAPGQQWRVVARNAAGTVLHEVAVKNTQQRHIEVFNPKTGAIDMSRQVKQADGVFEVSLPFNADIASVDVLAPASTNVGIKAVTAPLAKFDRASLEKKVGASKMMRSQSMAAAAPAATVTTVVNTGPSNARMDYVFIGDGYTAAEMGKWQADAKKVIDGFMADPLFAANRANMNVRRVDIASNQSGVDEIDKGIYRDTAMDGEFYCYNIERLLCVNETKVYNIVGSVLGPDQRDVIVVISNSTRYGGSGGAIATASMNTSSVEVALHEIGHTAFALADEYEGGTCGISSEPTEGNVSINRTRNVKWGSKIAAATPVPTTVGSVANGTVGVFQGGRYCSNGIYRPTENSRMRTLGYPWHAVNEGLVKTVFGKYTAVTQTGTLSSGGIAYAPNTSPGYIQAGNGTYNVQLTGPAGTDFDLSLYKSLSTGWSKVAVSRGNTSSESINYVGTAGYYYIEVKSYSGSGSYTVKYSVPPK